MLDDQTCVVTGASLGIGRGIAEALGERGATVVVKTDMLDNVPEHVQERLLERIPLDRFADIEDVTGITRFLASAESSYMSTTKTNREGRTR